MTPNHAARLLHHLLKAENVILDGLEPQFECSDALRLATTLTGAHIHALIELLRSELPEENADGLDEGEVFTDEALAKIRARRERPFFSPEVESMLRERGHWLATGSKR